VNVRKARGRRVAGGSNIGRIVGFRATGFKIGGAGIGAIRRGRIGCAGVAKAGEEEGMGFGVDSGRAEGWSTRRLAEAIVAAYKGVCMRDA
jgi:hypothetical protein